MMYWTDALILPTRDGNEAWNNSIVKFTQGFDPTYKGWKRETVHSISLSPVSRFDPTYKGWKRERDNHLRLPFRSFDPTYKGWKRSSKNHRCCFCQFALILPTRDGNRCWESSEAVGGEALILPTRDGNARGGARQCIGAAALILPTRDGNWELSYREQMW